jgi:hypothetical protein
VDSIVRASLFRPVLKHLLRYKKNSSAILVVCGVTVIVYRPKYLEYPQIVDMPKLDEGECKLSWM